MINEITVKSVLRKHKFPDSWFISSYGMNLYRGCSHGCLYCDGRHEKYRVEGDFTSDIAVKINAAEILERELDPAGKRKAQVKGFILPGGGVGDIYQDAENRYGLTRKVLEVISRYGKPVHILTKSVLVKRDIDIIREINSKAGAIVSFSISSSNEKISSYFEPGASSVRERLKAVEFFRTAGIHSGIFLMPVMPYITDGEDILKQSLLDIRNAGADYMVFGGLTLKEGRQKELFYSHLAKSKRSLVPAYESIYPPDPYGSPSAKYMQAGSALFNRLTANLNVPKRIPLSIFGKITDIRNTCAIALEQMDHLLGNRNMKSGYGRSARIIRNSDTELWDGKNITVPDGVDRESADIIREIITSGTSGKYEKIIKE